MIIRKLIFRIHALKRMLQRGISPEEIRHSLASHEIIEEYPDDKPYASYLVLGWHKSRPLHVVIADNPEDDETVIITVYEPDLQKWQPGFRRRKS